MVSHHQVRQSMVSPNGRVNAGVGMLRCVGGWSAGPSWAPGCGGSIVGVGVALAEQVIPRRFEGLLEQRALVVIGADPQLEPVVFVVPHPRLRLPLRLGGRLL